MGKGALLTPSVPLSMLIVASLSLLLAHPTSAAITPFAGGKLFADGKACTLCENAVNKAMEVMEANKTANIAEDVLIATCLIAGNMIHPGLDYAVCDGMVREFGSEVLFVLSKRLLNATETCSYFAMCPHVNVTHGHALYEEWADRIDAEMDKMDPIHPRVGKCPASAASSFVHISDAHVDPLYKEGADADCGEPLCCRKGTGEGANKAGPWGHYSCDATIEMASAVMDAASTHAPDFVLYTGDSPPHDDWQVGEGMTFEEAEIDQLNGSSRIAELFENSFYSRGIPVFPSVGNHEEFPVDQFPGPPDNTPLMSTLVKLWSDFLPPSTLATISKGGYYTTTVEETVQYMQAKMGEKAWAQAKKRQGKVTSPVSSLRVIAVNTMYCDALNFYLIKGVPDPAGQLAWLEQTLAEAEKNNEDVIIFGHIPPGNGGCLPTYARVLNALYQRYAHSIVAQVYGHTHKDEIELMWSRYTSDGKVPPSAHPQGSVFIGASITTYTDINPSYRLVHYCTQPVVEGEGEDIRMIDYEQHAVNLTEANLHPDTSPAFSRLYSFRDAYSLPSLAPTSIAQLTAKIREDETTARAYLYHYRAGSAPVDSCDEDCRLKYACEANSTLITSYSECEGKPSKVKSIRQYIKDFVDRLC